MAGEVTKIKVARLAINDNPTAASVAAILRDKVWFDRMLAGAGFPTPRTFGVLEDDAFLAFRPSPATYPLEAVPTLLDGVTAFCKPARGKGGQGAFRVTFEGGKALVSGEMLSAAGFSALVAARARERGSGRASRRLVLQEKVSNATEIARLYDGSVNTLRLLTHAKEHQPQVFSAVLRVGSSGNTVDNWEAGGLVVPVDPVSGFTRGEGIRKKDRARFKNHPDSGAPLSKVQLPHFDQAKRVAEGAHRLLAGLLTVGWDIAITTEGPRVLEANTKWDITMHHLTHPNFYRLVMKNVFDR